MIAENFFYESLWYEWLVSFLYSLNMSKLDYQYSWAVILMCDTKND